VIHERRCAVTSGEDRGRASNSGAAAAATQLQRQRLRNDNGGNYSSSSSNDGGSGHVGRTETGWAQLSALESRWARWSTSGRDGVWMGAMECRGCNRVPEEWVQVLDFPPPLDYFFSFDSSSLLLFYSFIYFISYIIRCIYSIYSIYSIRNPRVPKVPRVSRHTANFTGRCVPAPATGTVYAGTGTVWENPTRGLPVRNPNHLC